MNNILIGAAKYFRVTLTGNLHADVDEDLFIAFRANSNK